MAKLADAADLKSAGPKGLWGFDSPSRHQRQDSSADEGPTVQSRRAVSKERIAGSRATNAAPCKTANAPSFPNAKWDEIRSKAKFQRLLLRAGFAES